MINAFSGYIVDTMPTPAPDPRSFLPLTPLVLQVLLALADGDRHGYGIIGEVDARTGGLIRLRTGTLYTLLQRLAEQRLIAEAASRPAPDRDDERRRYYTLTVLGRSVLKAETGRLRAVVDLARARRVLGGA
jgi:DNA-binding PadR family transcriptional regulator